MSTPSRAVSGRAGGLCHRKSMKMPNNKWMIWRFFSMDLETYDNHVLIETYGFGDLRF